MQGHEIRGLDRDHIMTTGPRVFVGNLPWSGATKTGGSGQVVSAVVLPEHDPVLTIGQLCIYLHKP